jgi:predicted nicotinamide N-methyase
MILPISVRQSKAFRDYGLKIFGSRDKEVRSLKRLYKPKRFGFRIWTSSWLLMDFLRLKSMTEGKRVMDLGCGWGLAGIYCAKRHGAVVTSVDMDAQVFPFLRLHADANGVSVHTMVRRFAELGSREFSDIDIIIGSDICFWDDLVEPLITLLERAFSSGVQLALIADPGRGPFASLGRHFAGKGQGEFIEWSVERPYRINGQILAIAP